MNSITVVIADDHRLVRESLISVLQAAGGIAVVGEAGDGVDAVQVIRDRVPQVAIVDISMPGLNGLEVVRRVRHDVPDTRCLVLTMHQDEEYVLHVVRAGAAGFLLKDSPTAELIAAVRELADGKGHFGPHAARVLAEQMHNPQRDAGDPYGDLTPREREVFHLIVEGDSTKHIARKLDISVKTAENHRSRVMAKLGARNSADVVRYAARKGLIADAPDLGED